ncbi:MAG TPA: glycosyltransferase family 39 protein [Candidatus Acidoferrales bacterium]|nr:glycosyltransferase family 39 protein [Candidatus Acidoferrales bacterium]
MIRTQSLPDSDSMAVASTEEAKSAPVSYKLLGAIVTGAFLLRLLFMLKWTPVISGDGCEYIRMGINIRDGQPLTGSFDWPETMYGTLYPVLIAGVSRLGMTAEHAAYLLSLLFGTALVVIAFLLARYIYGDRVGYIAAALFAAFPVFIGLSGSVFNESIYLTLWLAGIYWSIRALDSYRAKDFLIAGICFGLSTLSRPEAFAYPLFLIIAAVFFAVTRKIAVGKVLRGAALVAGSWVLLMAPYAIFQHAHTGQYRFEGKWNINYTIGNRIDSGMSFWQAGYSIDTKHHFIGPLLDSSLYAAYTPYPHSFTNKLTYMAHAIRRNWPRTYDEVVAMDFGGPVMLLLAILGLFSAGWSLKRLRNEFVLLVMAFSIVFLMLTAAHIEHRYAYALPVISLLWVAAGLEYFRHWISANLSSWGSSAQLSRSLSILTCFVLSLVLLVFSAVELRTDWYFTIERSEFSGIKEAGLWLGRQLPKHARMFGFEGRVAYYADASIIIFPYADSAETLRYLDSKNIDYIELDSLSTPYLPALADWYQHGVPDPRAHLVFQSTQGSKDIIRIYKWDHTAAAANAASSTSAKE